MSSHKKKLESVFYHRLLSAGLFLVAFILVFLFGLHLANAGKISRGVRVADVDVGGLRKEQAIELLGKAVEDFEKNAVLRFTHQAQEFQARPDELGVSFDIEGTAEKAYEAGRNRNFFLGLFEQLKAIGGGHRLTFDYRFDAEKFRQWSTLLAGLETPAKNATLIFDEQAQDFIALEEKGGLVVDKKKLRADLGLLVGNLKNGSVVLSLIEDAPRVTKEETESARAKAKTILAQAPHVLKFDDWGGKVTKEQIVSWFIFEPQEDPETNNVMLGVTVDAEQVERYVRSLTPIINREAINAQFEFKNNRVTAFALGQTGRLLNVEKSRDEIIENLKENRRTTILAVQVIEPEITAQKAEQLGVKELLGRGVSDFAGSPKNRRENIRIGTAKFHGILIKPGEEFSFNEILGEVGPKQGYLPELVIKRNKTVPEYGGGLCQVSTTVFRAAVNSGLLITDRYQHSFPVKYYNPQGFDATIYPPSVDFKFKNDTQGHILVQSRIAGTKLTFEFYGASDGREVKLVGPIEYDKKPDGSMKARFTQEIYQNGGMIRKMTFRSTYRSPDLYPVERNPLE